MAEGDLKRIIQIGQSTLTPKQINEALRQLSTWTNLLEGRSGLIELRDGIQSLTSSAQAFANTAQFLPDASFGIFYTGVNGTDCWLASGAKLVGDNEWVALKTRAAMIKLSNDAGPLIYFNTALTPGTSFIPLVQSVTPTAPHWGQWYSSIVAGATPPGGSPIEWDQEIFADPTYFTRQTSDTEILILTPGVFQINTSCEVWSGLGAPDPNEADLILSTASLSFPQIYYNPDAVTDFLVPITICRVASISAGDVISVYRQGIADPAVTSRFLSVHLIQ